MADELEVQIDRYDGVRSLPHVAAANAHACESPRGWSGGDAVYEIVLPELRLSLYLPRVDQPFLELARDVLLHLSAMDNTVQRACAADCARSGIPPDNFESDLAFIMLAHEEAVLYYYGAVVNTEWDEQFFRCDGRWMHARE